MKNFLIIPVIALMFSVGAAVASADTSPEQSRTTITRSSGHSETVRPDRDRGRTEVAEDESPEEEGNTVLDITYTSGDGNLTITVESNGSGNANINVNVNGEVVLNNGGQSSGGNNTSEDGADGADGSDGNSGNDDVSEDNSDDESETEVEAEDDTRTRDRGTTENRRSSRI